MSNPVVNLTRTWNAVGDPEWRAGATIDDNLAVAGEGPTPIDAMYVLAQKLAVILLRAREASRREQEEARLRESR